MGITKSKNLSVLFLSISLLSTNFKSINTTAEEVITSEKNVENETTYKQIRVKKGKDYFDDRGLQNDYTYWNKPYYAVSDSHNAYTSQNSVCVPYQMGKYEEYSTNGNIDSVYENARSHFEIFDGRRNWSSIEYKENEVNGNLYNYTGEYRNKYYVNTRTLYKYRRDYYKTIKRKSYETRYKHKYRGNKWWNILLTKTYTNSSRYSYPNFDNYKYVGYDEISVVTREWEERILDKTEITDWRLSKPFKLFGPDWYIVDTKKEYCLGLERVLKWNPNYLQSFKCLQPIFIYDEDFTGLHLSQWNDISNLKNNRNYASYLEGRTDYIYINCQKFLQDIYKSIDHIIDVYKDELYDELLEKVGMDFVSSLCRDIIIGRISSKIPVVGPYGVAINLALIIYDCIKFCIDYSKEKERVENIKKSGYRVFEKLTDENLNKYKFCVFKINHNGLDLDFFDEIDNLEDNIREISLAYKNNEKANKSVHSYSDKNYTNIFGYPVKFNNLDYIQNAVYNVFRKNSLNSGKDLYELINNGTYSYL